MVPAGRRLLAILFAAVVAVSAAVLAEAGAAEPGVRMLVRTTARVAATFFLMAFAARPLHQLLRSPVTAGLLARRRELGVAAAFSLLVHLLAIGWLFAGFPHLPRPDPATLVLGGLGFLLAFAMAATSTDGAVRRLGARRWKLLHRSGAWYLYAVFAVTFVPEQGFDFLHAGFVGAFAVAGSLRAAAFAVVRIRRSLPASPPA